MKRFCGFSSIINKLFLYSFFIVIPNFSCTRLSPEENKIKETIGKIINIAVFDTIQKDKMLMPFTEFRGRYKFIEIVYLEDSCQPCYPKFIEWQTRMDTLDLNDNFTVLFIIQGRSYERFLNNLQEFSSDSVLVNERFCIAMDHDYRFLDNNPDIDRWIIDKSLLIDDGNKVRLIGPPFASPRMTELLYSICNQ